MGERGIQAYRWRFQRAAPSWPISLIDIIFRHANKMLMLGVLWAGLAAFALGALVYDVAWWLGR
jgi:hypothetical protein